jgi:protein arginine N-methyltransferase 1
MSELPAPKVDDPNLLGQYIPLHYHGQMLLSEQRMASFEEAIARVVPVGGRVLEFGGGTGVQSFFAARRAAHVICVERLPHVAAAARRFLADNGAAERVTVVEADAATYTPDAPVDVVICEMLHAGLLREKQTSIIAGFKQRYRERFGDQLPRFIPEATILAVQPVEQPFVFHGYRAPVTLFFEAGSTLAPTVELGAAAVYATVDYSADFPTRYTVNGELVINRAGELNALRFVTKNLVAIIPEEARSIDWHMSYMIAPVPSPLRVAAGARVRIAFDYEAGDSVEALLASIRVHLA